MCVRISARTFFLSPHILALFLTDPDYSCLTNRKEIVLGDTVGSELWTGPLFEWSVFSKIQECADLKKSPLTDSYAH